MAFYNLLEWVDSQVNEDSDVRAAERSRTNLR